ncbi:MAG: glutathione S-transferase C-terminal domain-containing protein [bacterium]|nr:glutathione S-transferase C-terminal domain-containing protein [bacterium]
METKHEIDDRGAFIRQPNAFIQPFGDKEGDLKAEAGRYTIYWAKGCNWSNRPVIARDLLGLQDVVADELVGGSGETNVYGWGFPDAPDHKDPITGAYFLSEFYKRANPEFKGRATTPTLADTIEKKAVNNDYHRLTNYLEVQFRPFQPEDAPDLYPKKFRREIDELNDWLFPHINNGHYRMAFCQSLEAYEEAFEDFYDSMDKLEERLATNRFLFGDFITDSDIRFFVTLVRWDISYFHNIGPVKHRIVDYKNIWGYARELYSLPAFKKNTYMHDLALGRDDKDKKLFADWRTRIAPQIDFEKLWAPDDSRRALSKTPDEWFLRHPKGETYEEYASEISKSIWNSPNQADRNPKNGTLSEDASINPLKGRI